MNRGSYLGEDSRQGPLPSFNEAPIHESGKCGRRGLRCRCQRASMRPRFMNRGSCGSAGSSPGRADRFNEAPIHESGK